MSLSVREIFMCELISMLCEGASQDTRGEHAGIPGPGHDLQEQW